MFGLGPIEVLILLAVVVLPIFLALQSLRKRDMSDVAKAIWAIISLIPVIGPLAFFIVRPGDVTEV